MRAGIRRNQRENRVMSEGMEAHLDMCAVLLDRMTQLIEALSPHQRDYHAVVQVDIYWYIQKRKEVEILINRLLEKDNEILKRYLFALCDDISRRIDADERVAMEYCQRLHVDTSHRPGASHQ